MAEYWMVHGSVTKEETCRCSEGALKVMHIVFFSQNRLLLNHPLPVCPMVNGLYYCWLLQDKVRPALFHKHPEVLECVVILLQDKTTPHRHHDLQNLLQWGWEVVACPPYSPNLASCDYWLFACVEEHLWGKWFELEHNFNTFVTLHHLSKDDYRAAIDHLPCRWEECVNSAGVRIE